MAFELPVAGSGYRLAQLANDSLAVGGRQRQELLLSPTGDRGHPYPIAQGGALGRFDECWHGCDSFGAELLRARRDASLQGFDALVMGCCAIRGGCGIVRAFPPSL